MVDHFVLAFLSLQTITYRPNKKNSVYNEKVDTVTLVEQACNGCAANSVQEQHIDTFVPAGVLPTETSSDVCMLQYALVVSVPSLYEIYGDFHDSIVHRIWLSC